MLHLDFSKIARSWSLMICSGWLLSAIAFADAPQARKAALAPDYDPVCVRCTSAETENESETDA